MVGWFAAIVTGRFPDAFHRFLGAYVRYTIHVFAFVFLVANPFPGFTGHAGQLPGRLGHRSARAAEPLDDPLPLPARVSRRIFVDAAIGGVLWIMAFLGWFAAIGDRTHAGRLPRISAHGRLRYYGAELRLLYLLTGSYPYSGPPAVDVPEAIEETVPVETWPEPPDPPSFSAS